MTMGEAASACESQMRKLCYGRTGIIPDVEGLVEELPGIAERNPDSVLGWLMEEEGDPAPFSELCRHLGGAPKRLAIKAHAARHGLSIIEGGGGEDETP